MQALPHNARTALRKATVRINANFPGATDIDYVDSLAGTNLYRSTFCFTWRETQYLAYLEQKTQHLEHWPPSP